MPDPALYLRVVVVTVGASAAIVLALGGWRRPASATRTNSACVLGIALALALGYEMLHLRPAWPPANGLGRFIAIVLPAVVGVELIAGFSRTPRRLAWLLRLGLAMSIGRVLLHNSVYLGGPNREWSEWQAVLALTACGAMLAMVWGLLSELSRRSPGVSLPLALSQSSLCGGLAVMLAGYVAGGEAALPLAAALAGAALASCLIGGREASQGVIGIGVAGLFSLLFLGRFFGRLSTAAALAIFLAPLLCWATEAPFVRHQRPWLVGVIRLALTAIPLALVLAAAKSEFDREMAPMLGLK